MKRIIEGLLLFILAFMFLLMPNTYSQNWINCLIFLWLADLVLKNKGDDK